MNSFTWKNRNRMKGKVGVGVLGAIMVVLGISIGLGFGGQEFFKPGPPASKYACCDSGNGPQCHPNKLKSILYNGDTYALLKSNIRQYDQLHLAFPHNTAQEFTPEGEEILISTSEHTAPNFPPSCVHDANHSQDFVSQIIPGQFDKNGKPLATCFSIPDDLIIFTCRLDNAQGDCAGPSPKARFDAYIRTNRGEKVPDGIANCTLPPIPTDFQQSINKPTNTEKRANLQEETFYVENEVPVANWLVPYCKPAIYVYPQTAENIHVSLEPALPLTYTDPQYPQGGWDVYAAPTGDITYQQKHYDYLYYETKVSTDSYTLPKEGYVVAANNLKTFLPTLVTKLGLNAKETGAFVGYWEKALPKSSYYEVKVVEQKQLDSIDPLFITPKPNTVIRVTLHFKALDKTETLAAPVIQPVKRSGFTVVEWGGMFERDANHPFSCLQ